MATLGSSDFKRIKKIIKQDPTAKAAIWGMGITKAVWYATFQAAEDWFVGGFVTAAPSVTFKAAVEAEAGSMTNAVAKQIAFVWMRWRGEVNP